MAAQAGCPPSREPLRAAVPFFPEALASQGDCPHPLRLLRSCGKMADRPVPVKDLRLLDVKLGELPKWVASRNYTPLGIIGALHRGYTRYQNKYINVKKGGISGIAMILTTYVVISYIWSYDHIKHDRWRKYH